MGDPKVENQLCACVCVCVSEREHVRPHDVQWEVVLVHSSSADWLTVGRWSPWHI